MCNNICVWLLGWVHDCNSHLVPSKAPNPNQSWCFTEAQRAQNFGFSCAPHSLPLSLPEKLLNYKWQDGRYADMKETSPQKTGCSKTPSKWLMVAKSFGYSMLLASLSCNKLLGCCYLYCAYVMHAFSLQITLAPHLKSRELEIESCELGGGREWRG